MNKNYFADKQLSGYKLHPAFKQCRTVHKAVGIQWDLRDGKFYWVDEDESFVNVDFDKQPPWCDIKKEGEWTYVPRFFIRCGTGLILISKFRLKGFRLHPTFKGKKGIHVISSKRPTTIFNFNKQLPCKNLENCDTCKFRYRCYTGGLGLFDYYSYSAIRLLAAVELRI